MNKLTLTVGIPTFNSEQNIAKILSSILRQRRSNYILKQIIVYSDCSADGTVEWARSIKSELIKVIDAKKRGGFAMGVKKLIKMADTELLLLLNDDIRIEDTFFIEKLVEPFLTNTDVGLVCGNPQPLAPNTFVEKALASRLKASEELSIQVNHGCNIFSCDGKTMLFSKNFYKSIVFPNDLRKVGNVDAYLYFCCLKQKLKYVFIKDAKVYYRNASNLKDYASWIGRNNNNFYLLKSVFGNKLISAEYKKPRRLFFKTLFEQFVLNPLGILFVCTFEIYIIFRQSSFLKSFSATWDIVSSTKNLEVVITTKSKVAIVSDSLTERGGR